MKKIDFSPANWLWLPGERTLPNTQVVFRRIVEVSGQVKKAEGWIFADSRYLLKVNGERVQWGPAPADPRWPEADPVEIALLLQPGRNEITVDVLWFGYGEGTYVPSNPGFILKMEIEDVVGIHELVSDTDWEMAIDRSLTPGGHAQFMLRALQEKRDLRVTPTDWLTPAVLNISADKPTLCGPAYPGGPQCLDHSDKFLRKRMIPLMHEASVDNFRLAEKGRVKWKRSPEDWFDFRLKDSFECIAEKAVEAVVAASANGGGAYLTFVLPEIMVGWPEVEIEAPDGTVVELIYQESHDRANGPWLDTMHYGWSRFTCAEGLNTLKPFDYYAMRFLQLHIHGNDGPVAVKSIRFRRRSYPFAQVPAIRCSEPVLQRLFEANLNTLRNSIQECNTDAVGRERQQYSGDCGHQQHPVRLLFGESGHGSRYLRTFADGQSKDGYFMDCWPGIDRLIRVGQRQLGITPWGPILDHGVGFVFDCYNHWMESGETQQVRELLPQLVRFGHYLGECRNSDGLVPAEHGELGTPSVWMDHDAYGNPATGTDKSNDARIRTQRRKTGSFNLYTAAMLRRALAPLCEMFGAASEAAEFLKLADTFEIAVRERFWSEQHGVFIDNLPWVEEDGVLHCSDRTLAMSVLYGFLDDVQSQRAAELLENGSDEMLQVGWSYIVNAVWRHRALIHAGRMGKVLDLLRKQWGVFPSIENGNAIPEHWHFEADSKDLWSHCGVTPLLDLVEGIAGISPLKAGFEKIRLCPQPDDVGELELTVQLPQGPVQVSISSLVNGCRSVRYQFPSVVNWSLELFDEISEGRGTDFEIKLEK
ncbi:alpha-L-rhamnosidase-related protein [Coraliomargarita sp. W4R53]